MKNPTIGVRRLELSNRIILSVPRAAISYWESVHGVALSKDVICDLSSFYETTQHRFEVQDGQHRLTALQQLVDSIADRMESSSGSAWKKEQLWWTAYIYDSGAIYDLPFWPNISYLA